MMAEPRARGKELAGFCRRMGTSLAAGIDVRTAWERESQGHGPMTLRARCLRVSDAVAAGESVADALASTGSYFPPLFLELVAVGEQTGNLAEVFSNLADHYEYQEKLRRDFLSAITWPLFQLFAALAIVGLVILVMGFLPSTGGKKIDILGLGLTGVSGLMIYLVFLAVMGVGLFFVYQAMRRGALWTRPIERFIFRLPVFGRFLETLALSRLAWTMHLTMNTSLDVRPALRLCLKSTQFARYTEPAEAIIDSAASGNSLLESFTAAGVFPGEFLDALEVGERSGQLPEAMGNLAEHYRDTAKRMMATLTTAGAFVIGGMVALLIIGLIFVIASKTLFPYIDTINELSR